MEHRTGTVVSYRFAAFYAIGVLLNFGFLYDKSIPCHKDRGHSCSASWDSLPQMSIHMQKALLAAFMDVFYAIDGKTVRN